MPFLYFSMYLLLEPNENWALQALKRGLIDKYFSVLIGAENIDGSFCSIAIGNSRICVHLCKTP